MQDSFSASPAPHCPIAPFFAYLESSVPSPPPKRVRRVQRRVGLPKRAQGPSRGPLLAPYCGGGNALVHSSPPTFFPFSALVLRVMLSPPYPPPPCEISRLCFSSKQGSSSSSSPIRPLANSGSPTRAHGYIVLSDLSVSWVDRIGSGDREDPKIPLFFLPPGCI